MSTDYSALLLEYPAVISKDQLYRICHISKRKATWLLENGIIPCRDSGKKTRRFQIYTADVVNYLITLENEPQKVAIPVGIFTSNKYRKKRENPVAHLPRSELKKHLCLKWRSEPDALTITQISKITGYKDATDLIHQAAGTGPPQLIRRLTPLECERLQGFPDGWTDLPGASDSARYRALGNSVAIPCVEFIMRGVIIAAGYSA